MLIEAAILAGMTGMDMLDPAEFGKRLQEKLEKEGKMHYAALEMHQRITIKGMIAGDAMLRKRLSHRIDLKEFDIVHLLAITSDWRTAINSMLDKWQSESE